MISKNRLPQRLLLLAFGLLVLAFGVGFSVAADLGVSPVSVPSFVFSLHWGITMGFWVIAMHSAFILFQIILKGKKYKLIDLTQMLSLLVFGYFVDFANWALSGISTDIYILRLLLMLISIVLISAGIVLFIGAKLASLPTEGFCLVVSEKYGFKFHRIKMIMDCSLVIFAIIFSFVALGGLYGVREGTVISAVLVGKVIPYIRKPLSPLLNFATIS